jgi:hypothetical protein
VLAIIRERQFEGEDMAMTLNMGLKIFILYANLANTMFINLTVQ